MLAPASPLRRTTHRCPLVSSPRRATHRFHWLRRHAVPGTLRQWFAMMTIWMALCDRSWNIHADLSVYLTARPGPLTSSCPGSHSHRLMCAGCMVSSTTCSRSKYSRALTANTPIASNTDQAAQNVCRRQHSTIASFAKCYGKRYERRTTRPCSTRSRRASRRALADRRLAVSWTNSRRKILDIVRVSGANLAGSSSGSLREYQNTPQ